MTSERIVHTILGVEANERRSLDVEERVALEARVTSALVSCGLRWSVRLLLVVVPVVTILWANGRAGGDDVVPRQPVAWMVLAVATVALMLFESAAVRDSSWRRGAYAFAAFGPVGVSLSPLGAPFDTLQVVAGVVWFFVFSFAAFAFVGRSIEDFWLLRALVPLARLRDPLLLRARGVVTMDPVPRRFRDLGVAAGRVHTFEVLEASFAIVSIDGAAIDGFPHVPIARVHVVERAEEVSVGTEGAVRITERTLTDGEVEELERIRARAMMKAYALAVPTIMGVWHLADMAHLSVLLGFSAGEYVALVGFPLMALIGVGVKVFTYLRFGRDLFHRRVRIERRIDARAASVPERERLIPSGRPWTTSGRPDPERMIPYD